MGKSDLRHRKRNGLPSSLSGSGMKKKSGSGGSSSSSSGGSGRGFQFNFNNLLLYWGIFGVIAVVGAAIYSYYLNYVRSRVYTPFGESTILPPNATAPGHGVGNDELFWGTYRPNTYFGMRHRSQHSLLAGLLWFEQGRMPPQIRHVCDIDDGLKKYMWTAHDGRHFGLQSIVDQNYLIQTGVVKRSGGSHGGDWTALIEVEPGKLAPRGSRLSLLFYFLLPDSTLGELVPDYSHANTLAGIRGRTAELGNFDVKFRMVNSERRHSGDAKYSHLVTHVPREDLISQEIMRGMGIAAEKGNLIRLLGRMPLPANIRENMIVFEVTATGSFGLEIQFESASSSHSRAGLQPLTGAVYRRELEMRKRAFDNKFADVFPNIVKEYNEADILAAKSILSSIIGGIGYFYGQSIVQSEMTPHPVLYWPTALFTATPSRPFFPRGFLWDEGFHQLLLSRWDSALSVDIISHWLDLLNVEGWIPREQILGWEARAKVPNEFVVQRDKNGNPPTFILPLDELLQRGELPPEFIKRAAKRLEVWFDWFNRTQTGPLPTSYRWRGREENNPRQLNPLTLTSGLDDYPRASHPTGEERHLDLRCWMARFADLMGRLLPLAGQQQAGERFASWAAILSDEGGLNRLHWAEEKQHFADYGYHTDKVSLVRPQPPPLKPGQAPPQQKPEKVRQVRETPRLQYVPSFGYISLFPLFLRLLSPDSPRLGKLLGDLADEKLLWTSYGLRSLARSSPLYQKRNTEHDPPYWRGAVWINMNCLAVRALKHYANVEGPYRARAAELHKNLRSNLVRTILGELGRTGFLWEQYNDVTGRGQRVHPFSGWTALVVLIMEEK